MIGTVIGTLAVDGWAVTFAIARRGLGGPQRAQAPTRYTHQRPAYQLRITRCSTRIAFGF